MKKTLLLLLLTVALILPFAVTVLADSNSSAGETVWELDFSGGTMDPKLSFVNANAEIKGGILAVSNTSNNPRLLYSGNGFELDALKISEIRIKVKAPAGATQAKLFFAAKSGKFSEAGCFKTQLLTPGEWQEIVFLTSERPNTWIGTIAQLRFDFIGATSGYELEYIRFLAGEVDVKEPVDGVADGAGWTMDFSTLTQNDAPFFYGENATVCISDGALQVSAQSSNPRVFYYGKTFSVSASRIAQIQIKLKAPEAVGSAQLFFAAPGGKFTQDASFTVSNIQPGEWQEIVIDPHVCAGWKDTVSQFRFDLKDATGDFLIESIKFIESEGGEITTTPPATDPTEEDFPHADRWFTDKKPITDYDYSFCVVGDTQVITERYPDKLAGIYDWIVANKDEKKIEFVFGLGDIVQYGTDAEWDLAKDAISRLDGVLPYSLVRGSSNHDSPEGFNDRFGTEEYKSQFIGFYDETRIENTYRTFRAGEVDYLFVTLEFGPPDTVLEWASNVISQYPNHRVIITTHMFLYHDGTTLDYKDPAPAHKNEVGDGTKNNGDEIWEKLVSKHENIFMILCGHDASSTIVMRQTKGDHGNTVTQMLINPQGVDGGQTPTGMVAMLYFAKDGRSIEVEYYSTVRNMYYMPANQFTIQIPEYKAAETEDTTEETVTEAIEETTEATTDASEEATDPSETAHPSETTEVSETEEATDTEESNNSEEKSEEQETADSAEHPAPKNAGWVYAAIGGAVVLVALGIGRKLWLGKKR